MTPSQLEAARREVDMMLDAARSGHHVKIDASRADALRLLLLATAPPSDEELAREATDWFARPDVDVDVYIDDAYIAGARREGRE
jgi:hypothetical protein